jgi:hypothetical protein
MLSQVRVDKAPQTGAIWWLPLALALVGLAIAVVALIRAGRDDGPGPIRRALGGLRRLTGLPGWCAAGISISLWALLVAVIGFVWDVSWHADIGRDKELFTPPHTMILTGLIAIGIAAIASIVAATTEKTEVGFRLGPLRVPWSSLPMGLMAGGAVIGFPLDDLWHRTYGIDVTMWSPTHLLMIGGASLTPIACWLMLAEAEVPATQTPWVRRLSEVLATATLLGLSTFQLEFDLGIPQWQALYHPMLVALAMGIGLLAAREALGPGGALRATLGFLGARVLIALLVGPAFGLSTPHFPLYLGGALAVEAIFLLGDRLSPMGRVLASGIAIATVGTGVEWAWTHVWGFQPWGARLLAWWWVVVVMALVCSLIGSALGRAVAHEPMLVPYLTVGVALGAMALLLAVPYPRHGSDAVATVGVTRVGPDVPVLTRNNRLSVERDVTVQLKVDPPDAVRDADVLRAFAWQGGKVFIRDFHPVAPGAFATSDPLPTGGTWKSLIFFSKGSVVAAVPISFPNDLQYGLKEIPPPFDAPRVAKFKAAHQYLVRESHSGNALPAILAYTGMAIVAIVWFIAMVGVGETIARRMRYEPQPRRSTTVSRP